MSGGGLSARTLAPVLMLLVACSSPVELAFPDEDGRVLGAIEHYGDSVRVDLPAEVAAREEFGVTVTTYGGGCISKGDMEVSSVGLRATLTPYDYDETVNYPGGIVCTAVLITYQHEAVLRFDRAGTARVLIRGQRQPSGEIFTVVRTVEVR